MWRIGRRGEGRRDRSEGGRRIGWGFIEVWRKHCPLSAVCCSGAQLSFVILSICDSLCFQAAAHWEKQHGHCPFSAVRIQNNDEQALLSPCKPYRDKLKLNISATRWREMCESKLWSVVWRYNHLNQQWLGLNAESFNIFIIFPFYLSVPRVYRPFWKQPLQGKHWRNSNINY